MVHGSAERALRPNRKLAGAGAPDRLDMARIAAMRAMPRTTAAQPSIKPASARPAPCSPVRLIWLLAT